MGTPRSPPVRGASGRRILPFLALLGVVGVLLLTSSGGGPTLQGTVGIPSRTVGPVAELPGTVHHYHFATAALQRPGWSGVPAWLVYDHGVGSFYVAEAPSGVGVLRPGAYDVNLTIPVGNSPFAAAYDPNDGRVFVTNTGSDNVSVIADATNTTVGSVAVGTSPSGIAFDNRTDRVYVANGGSDNVSVLNGSSLALLTTIAVGAAPVGVAYDWTTNVVVVANSGSNNVSVIDAATMQVVANPAVGDSPYAVAIDTANGAAYVSNAASGNVTVLNQTTTGVAATIPVGAGLAGLTYDSRNQTVWVDEGRLGVVVIYAPTNQVVQFLEFDPQGAAYDPDQNVVCVTNSANSTFECLMPGNWQANLVHVAFVETGLPSGTSWSVSFGGVESNSSNATIRFAAPSNFAAYYSVGPVSQYAASPANGYYNGNYLRYWNVSINFTRNSSLFVLRFLETGLSLQFGESWELNVSGEGVYGSELPTIALSLPNGSYAYTPLPSGTERCPTGVAVVNGSDTNVTLRYQPEKFPVTFQEVDLPAGLRWSVTFNGTEMSLTTDGGADSLPFAAQPDGSYAYDVTPVPGWVPSYFPMGGTANVSGGPLNVTVYYSVAPVPPNSTYTLTFRESGLPADTSWGIVLGSSVASSATQNVTFTEPNGSYGFVVLAVGGYVASAPSAAVVAGSNTTVSVTFRPQTYPIVFVEFGLPAGTNWSVTVTNNSTGFNVTEHSTTNSLTFFLPNGTYTITFGLPAGYSGTASSTQITVTGRAATGATLSVGPRAPPGRPSEFPWETAAIFAVAGALAASGVALLWRRRTPPPPTR